MKIKIQFQKYLLVVILTLLAFFSVFLAFHVYREYPAVARGISGVAMATMLFYFGKSSNLDVTINELFLDKRKSKYIISALFVPLLFYFATLQIYEMMLVFMKR